MIREILFTLVVFLTNIIQCVTGFAGTVLAMPFSVLLIGYDAARPILNALGLFASVYVVITCFRQIDKKELAKMTGVMLIGMAAGLALRRFFTGNPSLLYKTLGILVLGFAVMNAVKFYTHREEKLLPAPVSAALLVIAGVVHGLFVCGGPLLVTYAGAKLHEKDTFRGTLSAVWIVLNGVIFATDLVGGSFTPSTVRLSLLSAAVLAAALIVGHFIAKKLSRGVFLQITYILMAISGISLLIK